MSARVLSILVVVPLALAGCFHEDPPSPEFHATAADAKCSIGYAYDGSGLQASAGTITIDVNEETNAGQVTATFTLDGVEYTLDWTNFTGDPTTFQSGGVARDFMEHGDSGNGDTLLPAMFLVSAGWGTARLSAGGVEVPDPFTGGPWTVHYMATNTGVRADDGKVRAASGTYSPDAPANGANAEGDHEVWLVLKPGASAPEPLNLTSTEQAQGPNYEKTFPFTVAAPGGDLRVTFATDTGGLPGLPGGATDLTFTLMDANGTEVQTAANSGEFTVPGALGDYELTVSGNTVQATYDVAVTATYPSDQHRVCVFESATW